MSRPKYVQLTDPETGQPYLVPIEDYLGTDPGIGIRRTRDLMSRLPDAELAGFHGPGIVPHGESPHGGGRKNAPETFRPLGGAPQQARGDGKMVTVGGSNPTQVLSTIVESARGNGEDAESIIVTLGLDTDGLPDAILQTMDIDVTANLLWGVGGASFRADVDWMNGTTFVLPANYVRVGATFNVNTAPSEGKFVLFASLSYGQPTGGRLASPVRKTQTVATEIAPGAASDPIAIPKFGISMNLIDTQANSTSYLITFYKNANTLLPMAKYVKTDRSDLVGTSDSQFLVPNGALYFDVRNIGGALAEGVKAVFNLGL